MKISSAVQLLVGIGVSTTLTGCPVTSIEKPSTSGTPSVGEDSSKEANVIPEESGGAALAEVETPFSVIVKLPSDAEDKLTDRQKFAIEARRKHPTTLRSEMVRVNFFKLEQQTLLIEAFGKTFTAVKTGGERDDEGEITWKGIVKECGNTEVEIRADEPRKWMRFAIKCNDLQYHLDALSEGNHLLMEVNLDLWHPKDDQTSMLQNDETEEDPNSLNLQMLPISTATPVLRVLVVYTTEAGVVVEDTGTDARDAVKSMNQSFINSQINYSVELAGILETNYQETLNAQTDLDRFRLSNDGYMDEIHSVRSDLRADVAVLVRNMDWSGNPDDELCGRASRIDAASATAFVTVYWWCMNPMRERYTFTHEIGHLHGCRHQPSADSGNTPFAYGHGYLVNGKWSTIVTSVSDPAECPDTCPRVNYWSSPSITKDGSPMGTALSNDNARVMRTRSTTVSAFYNPSNNYTVPVETLSGPVFKDYFAIDSVANNGAFVVNSGAEGSFRAKSVILNTGFHAKSGSRFTAERVM